MPWTRFFVVKIAEIESGARWTRFSCQNRAWGALDALSSIKEKQQNPEVSRQKITENSITIPLKKIIFFLKQNFPFSRNPNPRAILLLFQHISVRLGRPSSTLPRSNHRCTDGCSRVCSISCIRFVR